LGEEARRDDGIVYVSNTRGAFGLNALPLSLP
jgi:hypothetical protein